MTLTSAGVRLFLGVDRTLNKKSEYCRMKTKTEGKKAQAKAPARVPLPSKMDRNAGLALVALAASTSEVEEKAVGMMSKKVRKPRLAKPKRPSEVVTISASPPMLETLETHLCGKWVLEIQNIGLNVRNEPVEMNVAEISNDGPIHRRAAWAYAGLTGKSVQNTFTAFKLVSIDQKARWVVVQLKDDAQAVTAFNRIAVPISGEFSQLGANSGVPQVTPCQIYDTPLQRRLQEIEKEQRDYRSFYSLLGR